MPDQEHALLRIAAEELARRRGGRARGPRGEAGRRPGDGGSGDVGRKRMFMAGRVGPEASRVHYGESTRPPVRGPWDLALVVRPR